MRLTNKYEAIVAEYIHAKANRDLWPFAKPEQYLDSLSEGDELIGKEFVCVWQRGETVFTKECDYVVDFVEIPSDAMTIPKHEIEEDFHEQFRSLIEC